MTLSDFDRREPKGLILVRAKLGEGQLSTGYTAF